MVLAGLGLIWSMLQRKIFPFIILVWILILVFLANLGALRLPGSGLITNPYVEIMLFMPVSLFGGYLIDQILRYWADLIPKPLITPSLAVIFILFGFVSYLGARQLVSILNPVTILSRQADLPAIAWINDHIPKDETIVINPFSWGFGLFAGNDGGYWISPLSGQPTLPPPVLYGIESEAPQISQNSQEVINLSSDPYSLGRFMRAQHLYYVYIGGRGGVLSPEKLAASGYFEVLYQQDGVWIFHLKP